MKLANQSSLASAFALAAVLTATMTLAPKTSAATTNAGYTVSNLISDTGDAPRQNENLINPIGIEAGGQRILVAENGTGKLANLGTGQFQITVPSPSGGTNVSKPTGIVQNPTLGSNARAFFITNSVFTTNSSNPTNVIVTQRIFRGPATVITVTEDGTIAGWNPSVSHDAIIVVNNSGNAAVYKGATVAKNSDGDWELYVANFHSSQIEVYDSSFHFVKTIDNPSFVPAGFAPFNVKEILGNIVVAYAKQGLDAIVDEAGAGNGYIIVLNENGAVVRNFAAQGPLNSPWGLAYAPRHFGKFSHALLVGNNGDGRINAFDIITGENLGQISDRDGTAVTIDGLWALDFNTDPRVGSLDYESARLFFTAGPAAKTHGLVGSIRSNAPFSNR